MLAILINLLARKRIGTIIRLVSLNVIGKIISKLGIFDSILSCTVIRFKYISPDFINSFCIKINSTWTFSSV